MPAGEPESIALDATRVIVCPVQGPLLKAAGDRDIRGQAGLLPRLNIRALPNRQNRPGPPDPLGLSRTVLGPLASGEFPEPDRR